MCRPQYLHLLNTKWSCWVFRHLDRDMTLCVGQDEILHGERPCSALQSGRYPLRDNMLSGTGSGEEADSGFWNLSLQCQTMRLRSHLPRSQDELIPEYKWSSLPVSSSSNMHPSRRPITVFHHPESEFLFNPSIGDTFSQAYPSTNI